MVMISNAGYSLQKTFNEKAPIKGLSFLRGLGLKKSL